MRNGSGRLKFAQRLISLKEADDLLENMERNRPLRASTVARYTDFMETGRWRANTTASIAIGKDGKLLDGQHRLVAMLGYGKPVEFVIFNNVDPEAQEFMDLGQPRTVADDLAMNKVENAQFLAPAAHWCMLHQMDIIRTGGLHKGKGVAKRRPTFTPLEVRLYIESNPRLTSFAPIRTRSVLQPSLQLFLYSTLGALCEVTAAWFLERIHDGVGLEAGSSILLLRNLIQKEKESRFRVKTRWDVRISYCFKAWDLLIDGETRSQLKGHVWTPKAPENGPVEAAL